MRVLFTTFAAKSHLYAQVPLAWALQTAGHDVRVASHPDLIDDITGTGLTAVGVGEELHLENMSADAEEEGGGNVFDGSDIDPAELRPEKLTWDYMLGLFTTMTTFVYQGVCSDQMVDETVEFSRWWRPDLVVWDTMTFAGPVAARVVGAAQARLLFGLDLVGRMRASYCELLAARPGEVRDDPMAEWLGWTLARHGAGAFSEDLVTGQWTLCPVPSSMRFPLDLHYVPVRYVPYNGRSVIASWLGQAPKRPRVCVTLGVAHREVLGQDRASIADLIEAVAGLDVEVIATLNAAQVKALDRVPDNVRVVDFVPLNALLPSCSVIIHHGGSGTFQNALVQGVPQIIVPDMVWDTIHKAYALERHGVGVYVRDTTRLTGGELRGYVQRLIEDPSYRRNAARIRTEMHGTPSPNEIVPTLERLTAIHKGRPMGG